MRYLELNNEGESYHLSTDEAGQLLGISGEELYQNAELLEEEGELAMMDIRLSHTSYAYASVDDVLKLTGLHCERFEK
ncbi:MAG: hypothetical protein CO186_09880 [Zetaproteobacteria bacterium CG_4_9_14_3_um_filter_49_83]|nr:MAG: hypothetical protein AUJ56_07155 [Zetaproteobacteria bacterium CG1_02_49_23]PIQ34567.1 MAG: hypothetical protein COW62_01290 [Zetaproteobacteria bacterium CG17_big_fil_post_rev_8_21_14_2_50_50_13]PIV29421.1 MAG: hypothetical protein COS35_12225 [Zetaproteobacteria bacterium CG02_land_8_20_14_3_00_50_9]PIY56582.1 MAG: hypothetical protein COZ00_03540 [Zetaproteobacteria bacterium CG_4_10_14_0_8_um_filter_49_80]PJA34603.1 MAG: hypothetical protein CO186_09880 [Zetaproteobacteria bacterium